MGGRGEGGGWRRGEGGRVGDRGEERCVLVDKVSPNLRLSGVRRDNLSSQSVVVKKFC